MRAHTLPIAALVFTLALSTVLTSLNRYQILQAREQPVLNAIFCLEAAITYALYKLVSRVLAFALGCIEHSRPVYVDDDELGKEDDPPVERQPRGIQREALISSMYLGGSGCFLAIPALGFWDLSVTSMLLLSLALVGLVSEHSKYADFTPNQDKVTVLRHLRWFRWALYATVISLILCVLVKDNFQLDGTEKVRGTIVRGWPMMFILAFVSPLLLRLAIPQPTTSLMTPSQVLEAALPVSCLHALLVLSWYSPPSGGSLLVEDFQAKALPIFVPMLLICPFCHVAILAFILRGFRHKQTLPTVIVLALAAVIVQQVLDHRMRAYSDMVVILIAGKLIVLSICFLVYRARAISPPKPEDEPLVDDPRLVTNLQSPDEEDQLSENY